MIKLRPYQQEAVDIGIAFMNSTDKKDQGGAIIVAPTGCLSGDTLIQINNRKNSGKIKIKNAYERFNGLKYKWRFKEDIFTRSMLKGRIGLNKVNNIVYSGEKDTILLKFNNKKELILTPEHKIFSDKGWVEAKSALGQIVAFDKTKSAKKHVKNYVNHYDNFKNVGENHPFSRRRVDKRDGSISYRIEEHRAIYEAYINGCKNVDEYIKKIRDKENLVVIDPKKYHIHHIDFDHKNNDPKNLIHMEIKKHQILHSEKSKENFGQGKIGYSKCISIEKYKKIKTYDLQCQSPYNNFIANGMVVHNSGKSIIISSIAHALKGKTLVLQPSLEILQSNLEKAEILGIKDIGVYSASADRKDIGKLTFATIKSIINKKELFSEFDHLIIDENHAVNAKGGMYEELINYMGGKVLGLTATPYRLYAYRDFKTGELSVVAKFLHRTRPRMFAKIIHITQVADLYKQGFLCQIDYLSNKDYNHSEIKLNSTGMDFDEKSLFAYNQAHSVISITSNIILSEKSKHILVFMSSVGEATELSDNLKSKGLTSEVVSAKTPKKDRAEILRKFKTGEIRVVCNFGTLTTGYDFPALDCVILGRPTQSVALYYQMMGRGIRIAPGKEKVRIIDICGNIERFGKIEEFEIVEEKKNMHRLKSNASFLTGYDFYHNRDIESTGYAGLCETEFKRSEEIVRFGKFKGQHISKISNSYLEWGKENLGGSYKEMFQKEYKRRQDSIAKKQLFEDNSLPF